MLKIFDNYYLDANSVCYMLKKAHVKGDGMEECDVCTYHTSSSASMPVPAMVF